MEAVGLDAGYLTTPICHGLAQRNIFGVIAHRRYQTRKGFLAKWKYKYDEERDVYVCPQGEVPQPTVMDIAIINQIRSSVRHVLFIRSARKTKST